SPEEAACFEARVRGQTDLVAEGLAFRGVRQVNAAASDVVLPTVVQAAQAKLFVTAVEQRRASMGAVRVDKSDATGAVPKGDEVFTHQSHSHGRTVRRRQLAGKGEGKPEATEKVAHRAAPVGVGDGLVVFW